MNATKYSSLQHTAVLRSNEDVQGRLFNQESLFSNTVQCPHILETRSMVQDVTLCYVENY